VKDRPLASDNREVRTAELRHPGRLVRAIAAAFGAGWRVQRGGRLPFDRLIEELRKGKPFEGALADPDLHQRVVCRLLPMLPPWRMGRCMKRSLLLLNLWSRCGLAPCVHLGVAPLGEGLLGHAWLTAEAHGRTLQAGSSEGQREAFAFPPPSF
jgi:transglutaminase superfamily protein